MQKLLIAYVSMRKDMVTLGAKLKKAITMAKKLSSGVALVLVVLIVGLLLSSASATTIEREIWVSPREPDIYEFSVEKTGTIYAEARLEEKVEEPFLILEFLSTGEVKETVWGKSGELLTLSHDISEEDLAIGTKWKISVGSGAGVGSGYIKIDYPSDTTPPTVIITCSPENPTANQEITFIVTASDRSGIDKIEILVNAEKVEECFDSSSCTYIGGPYPEYAGTSVSYGANAYDKVGNRAWTGYKSVHISEARNIIPPTAVISATPTEITGGETVSFSAAESYDPDGYIVSYNWDFGDGSIGEGVNVEHAYSHSGHYTATLTVTDNDGLSDSNRVEITANPLASNTPPTAYIDISPNPASMGETVTFEGYGEDEDGEVVECRWTFPDGITRSVSGGSDYFEDEDVQEGWYSFAVRDDEGAWSEEARVELELEAPPTIPWTWILAAIVLVITAPLIIRMAIRKPSQLQINIETRGGIESMHEPKLQQYTINVEVRGGIERL